MQASSLPQQRCRPAAAHKQPTSSRCISLGRAAQLVRAAAVGRIGDRSPEDQEAVGRRAWLSSCACCAGVLALPGLARADQGVWSYSDLSGRAGWGGACSTGRQQSPINLPSQPAACEASQPGPAFSYEAGSRVFVKNTGTTIEVDFEPGSNSLAWSGRRLRLLQYHFHTPSEHAFDGKRAAMEAHLVHQDVQTGGYLVLGVLLQPPADDATPAPPNPCLAAALEHVPAQPQARVACPVPVDPLQLLPGGRGGGGGGGAFVHYAGSLTTPPCSEAVDWLVWRQALPVPEAQVLAFARFAGAGSSLGSNARPLQPANGRPLDWSCVAGSS